MCGVCGGKPFWINKQTDSEQIIGGMAGMAMKLCVFGAFVAGWAVLESQAGVTRFLVSPSTRIGAGANGINRDHLAPGKRAWSWHVTEFVAFAEGWDFMLGV